MHDDTPNVVALRHAGFPEPHRRAASELADHMNLMFFDGPWYDDTMHCLAGGDGPWIIVHSDGVEIRAAIERGHAILTRLDGDFWLNF